MNRRVPVHGHHQGSPTLEVHRVDVDLSRTQKLGNLRQNASEQRKKERKKEAQKNIENGTFSTRACRTSSKKESWLSATFTFAFLSFCSFAGVCCSFFGFASAKLDRRQRINKINTQKSKEKKKNLQLRKLAAIEDSFKVIEHGLQHLSSVGSVGGLVLDDVLRTQEVRCKDDSEVPRVHFGLHRKLGHLSQEEHQKHQQRVILRGKVRNHLLDFKQSITKNERSLRKCK